MVGGGQERKEIPKATPNRLDVGSLKLSQPPRSALKRRRQLCQRVIHRHGGIKRGRVCSPFTGRPLMFGFSKPFQHDVFLADKRQEGGEEKGPQTCKLNVKGTLHNLEPINNDKGTWQKGKPIQLIEILKHRSSGLLKGNNK